MVETPLLASPLVYLRQVDTNVYVSPRMVLSKSASIIHVVIVAHPPSCIVTLSCVVNTVPIAMRQPYRASVSYSL